MPFRPLVALKSKMGELDAIHHITPDDQGTRPGIILELLDTVRPADGAQLFPALVEAAAHMVLMRHPLWIDTHALSGNAALAERPGGPFEFLEHCIETNLVDEFGLLTPLHVPDIPILIPVVSDRATDDELGTVASLREHRQRDVVVRFRDLAAPVPELHQRLQRIARMVRTQPGDMHGVIDLGFVETVSPADVRRTTSVARMLIDQLGPDSTTLLAGSVPATRNGYVTTARDRPEVALWLAVADEMDGAVRYGDYGVTHPAPPANGPSRARNPNPYLYYTIPGCTILFRRQPKVDGNTPPGAAAEAFADLAEELVSRPEFAGRDYSWGDRELAQCRRGGRRTAGSVSQWLSMATSHHMSHLARRMPDNL